jgi:CheY-like chemotaxis protein
MNGVPAIAVSGYASDDDRHKALSVGYVTLVPKPIDVDILFDLIHDLNLPLE